MKWYNWLTNKCVNVLITKYLFATFIFLTSIGAAEDHWVNVPKSEPVIHRLDALDEDRSIWVVFSKRFDTEKVFIRFPEDPTYRTRDARFEAVSSQRGSGEFSLVVSKKNASAPSIEGDVVWKDAETGNWIRERHIETQDHHYVLKMVHSSDSAALFHQFVDSFEIQNS